MAFESLSERLNGVFKKLRGKGKLSEADIKAAMREVRMALLEADVNYKVAKDFCAQVSERAMGQEVMESLTPAQQVVKIVNEELTKLMGGEEPQTLHIKNKGQTVMMMCGLQGNGKTTHAAKLGRYYKAQGRRPLLVACDIYRPAAIDQLRIVGEQAGVPVYEMGTEKPEKIAKQAVEYAKDHGYDIVIIDTAGRLQIDDQLMDELVRIKQTVEVDETLQGWERDLESDDPQWAEHKLESNASSYIMNDSDNNYLWNSPTAVYYGWPEQGAIPDDVLAHYDTYRISGLPAGAITNPGIDAIAAALNPDQEYLDEGYYFFVTGNPNGDHPGEYFYAKTADEHHQNCIIAGWG